MYKSCDNCGRRRKIYRCDAEDCFNPTLNKWKIKQADKVKISLPILNNLTPNLHSCTLKVYEEVGELARELGKGQGLSGEVTETDHAEWVYRTIGEALDSMQSIQTLICVIANENNVDIPGEVERHCNKLRKKGYLK